MSTWMGPSSGMKNVLQMKSEKKSLNVALVINWWVCFKKLRLNVDIQIANSQNYCKVSENVEFIWPRRDYRCKSFVVCSLYIISNIYVEKHICTQASCMFSLMLSCFYHLDPGVDVMITIFCDFCQFSAKKLAFFSRTNVMIKILHNLALFWVKNANFFAKIFSENILKILTSVPDW
jgi:hypothetical protein